VAQFFDSQCNVENIPIQLVLHTTQLPLNLMSCWCYTDELLLLRASKWRLNVSAGICLYVPVPCGWKKQPPF